MRATAREKRRERLHRDCGNNKGDAQSERIDCKQANALEYGRFRRRQRKNSGKDRPDARRPSECKSEAHQVGAPQADRLADGKTLFALEPGDRGKPKKMQAHGDDGETGEKSKVLRISEP